MRPLTIAMLLAGAAPALAQDEWFPLRSGATWTFDVKRSDVVSELRVTQDGTAKLSCVGRDKVDKQEAWELEWSGKAGRTKHDSTIWLRLEGDRLDVLKCRSNYTPVLPTDFKERRLKAKVTMDGDEMGVESTVGAEEEVEVPAGTFTAVKVTATAELSVMKSSLTTWYAKGTGPVKIVRTWDAGGGLLTEVECVLRKFEKGK